MNHINIGVYSHRGEYYNEMVDELVEKGRLNI